MEDGTPGASTTGRDYGTDPPPGRVWVVSDGESDCTHPTDRLRRVGDDGINTYHRCDRCGAVLVSQDGLVRAAATAGDRPR